MYIRRSYDVQDVILTFHVSLAEVMCSLGVKEKYLTRILANPSHDNG